jgi:hypothetical protein
MAGAVHAGDTGGNAETATARRLTNIQSFGPLVCERRVHALRVPTRVPNALPIRSGERRKTGDYLRQFPNARTETFIVPIFSIVATSSSPGFSGPTPAGVPLRKMSPGYSV